MSTAMRVEVDGVEISPDQFTRSHGWKTAGEKIKQGGAVNPSLTRRTQASQGGAKATTDVSSQATDLGGATRNDLRQSTQKRINKGKLLKGARLPDLPRDDTKIIMRPRGGLRVSEVSRPEVSRAITTAAQVSATEARDDVICLNNQQNIIIVSTPVRERADKYAAVQCIDIRGTSHAVSTYESAPRGTVKGVIRGVPLEDTADEIQELVVHEHNPTALQANRIRKTMSVVIAFAGHKVPNYVRYGNALMECTLHRKQIDVCYQCGHVGHRMDVCPNPQYRICRGCGLANPDEDHLCDPKCALCGGNHLTADRKCKARFKTPYVVRRRRWERRRAEEEDYAYSQQAKRGHSGRPQRSSSPRSRSRTPTRGGGRQSRRRSRSRSRGRTPSSAGRKGGGNRRWEMAGGDPGSSGRQKASRSRSRASSRSRAGSRSRASSRAASTGRRGILAEKKVGWTNGSPVARVTNDKDFPPLNPNPSSSHSNMYVAKQSDESAELKKIIERQNAQIQEQNAQIRALMNKIDALASGSSANGVTKASVASEDATEKQRKVPRRDPPSTRLARGGAAKPTQEAPGTQEAMDAENTVDRETAVPAQQIPNQSTPPQEGDKLAAILEAINHINVRLEGIEARLGNVEAKVETLSVKHERLAAKVANLTVRNRLAAMRKKRMDKIKESIAYRRGRIATSEDVEKDK